MRKILFVDRDGTIVEEPEDEQIDRLDKIRFVADAIPALLTLRAHGFELVMVTNQDGLGTDSFPQSDFDATHGFIMDVLRSQGVQFEAVHVDGSFPKDNAPTRKPGIGMLLDYLPSLDRSNSYVIGDRQSDVDLATNLGIGSFQIGSNNCTWKSIVAELVDQPRTATVIRKTSETDIAVSVNLDAISPVVISTGIGFFDHMIEQIAKHAGISIVLECAGDLHIDEHHTIEDVGLVLGSALSEALGDLRGVGRFGFLLPMDETLAQLALDLSGRPFLVFDANFEREYVGGLPTEMVEHFFHSLSQTLRATVNITVSAGNTHHQVESIFKGFGRVLRAAVSRSDSSENQGTTNGKRTAIPSSKGTLSW